MLSQIVSLLFSAAAGGLASSSINVHKNMIIACVLIERMLLSVSSPLTMRFGSPTHALAKRMPKSTESYGASGAGHSHREQTHQRAAKQNHLTNKARVHEMVDSSTGGHTPWKSHTSEDLRKGEFTLNLDMNDAADQVLQGSEEIFSAPDTGRQLRAAQVPACQPSSL